MNYKYAKIINENEVSYAPRILKIGKKTYINPKESIYNQAGYYKIVLADYPATEGNYIPFYELVDNQIIQSWINISE